MHNAQHNYLGLYGHAMLLSLPPVLLVWAILTFTISIVAYAVQGITGVNALHPASAWVIVGVFIILLVAVIAALYTFSIIWKFQRKSWRIEHWKALWTRRRCRNIIPDA
jgi:membrane protein YdbS with pleckstrin-like domain